MSKESKLNLSEALKRHNLLLEYNFYIPRKDESDNMFKGEENTLDEQDVATPETEPTDVPTEKLLLFVTDLIQILLKTMNYL